MTATKLQDLVNPEVMADMITAELKAKLKATKFYKVNTTLTGRAGDTITVPTWKYIGPADTVPEAAPARVVRMETSMVEYTVKKASIIIELTTEAILSGHGDPLGEATRQLRMSIQDKMDNDGVELLQGIDEAKGKVLRLKNGQIKFENVIEALHMLERDNEDQGIKCFLMAHHETVKAIRTSPEFLGVSGMLRDSTLTSGAVGTLAGAQIIISNKLKTNEAYLLTPYCLTAFMKRDIIVNSEYDLIHSIKRIGANCHYVIAIEYYDKLVAMRWD